MIRSVALYKAETIASNAIRLKHHKACREYSYTETIKEHNLGNRNHRSYATLTQNSSANLAQYSELRASQPLDYEARWPPMGQINSSMQQNMLPDIHQRTGYEENAADEIFSRHGVTKQNLYNPETSDFPFPGMHPIQENETNSTHLQLPYEVSKVSLHQNSQNYGPLNPEY
ncbi:hypothetical protein CDAR_514041 [Caerostris darwini]|uniref:Uncharacterized protein n=1 Tax=Caerostris darwini TaxID=1538125 RepID=A0AAV4R322_9ARAC|nr:hypothetical protein CDAR_514041 [Caerostris darwini]